MTRAPGKPGGGRRAADRRAAGLERRYLDALRVGDARRANALALEGIAIGLTATEIQSRVIAPAMRAIGDLWAADVLTIADEHLATAISHTVEAELFPELLDFDAPARERVVVTAVEGERHTLGARMAADVLEGAGFDVLYLGADTPADGLVGACARWRPAIVALSATMPLSAPVLDHTVDRLSHPPEPPLVIASGRACGAPAFADAPVTVVPDTEVLVATLDRILGSPRTTRPVPSPAHVAAPAPSPGASAPQWDAQLVETAAAAADLSREHARRAASLERIAFRDPLTGLANRRALDDRLLVMAADAIPAAILMVDVDGFKEVNDVSGHTAGDAALRAVAASITGCLRPGDIAARYGGDEFTVVLPRTRPGEARLVAERIRHAVDSAGESGSTVSIGMSELGSDPRAAMITADRALYAAKAGGRNRVVFADA